MKVEMESVNPPLRPLLENFAKGPNFVDASRYREGSKEIFWRIATVRYNSSDPPLKRFLSAAKELAGTSNVTGTDKVIDLYLLGNNEQIQPIPRVWLDNDDTMRTIISMQMQMDLGVLRASRLNNETAIDNRQKMSQTIARLERINRLINPLGEEADFAI